MFLILKNNNPFRKNYQKRAFYISREKDSYMHWIIRKKKLSTDHFLIINYFVWLSNLD